MVLASETCRPMRRRSGGCISDHVDEPAGDPFVDVVGGVHAAPGDHRTLPDRGHGHPSRESVATRNYGETTSKVRLRGGCGNGNTWIALPTRSHR